MYKILLAATVMSLLAGCAPTIMQKCQKDYTYDSNGRLASEYSECITQHPGQTPIFTLKHNELKE